MLKALSRTCFFRISEIYNDYCSSWHNCLLCMEWLGCLLLFWSR